MNNPLWIERLRQHVFVGALAKVILAMTPIVSAETVGVFYDVSAEQIAFAAGDVKAVLEKRKFTVEMLELTSLSSSYSNKKIVIALASDPTVTFLLAAQGGSAMSVLGEQAYELRTTEAHEKSYWVLGGDVNGAMYGGLQVAENVLANDFKVDYDCKESPFLLNRGMKLNLPLDRRIPTYVGGWSSTSAKKAIPHVWDLSFWKTLIDQQARNRYNVLSVWVHHPFPALVKLPDYPKVCLPRIEGFDGFVKELDHDQRVAFWRGVMSYARDRGMKFYFFNWNIHLEHASSQYPALSEDPEDKETIDYMYKSMQALLETYPGLDGFGITSGDGMDGTKEENTQWTWNAMGKAVEDYLRENPERNFNLIHRGVKSDPETCDRIYGSIKKLPNVTFNMSAKYAMAHMYSTPTPKWTGDIESCKALGLKTWLTFRNDDYFYLNWGDPQFVRDFMNGIPLKESVVGMYIGIDGYNPSRAYCYRDESLNGKLEVERRWYMEMLWGRLSYNPDTSDDVFKNLLGKRYPAVSSGALYEAWSLASRSLPKVTELIMKDWALDFHWYPEGCWSDPSRCGGFRTINDVAGEKGGFAGQEVANGSALCSIADSASGICEGKKSSYALVYEMQADAKRALSLMSSMQSGEDADLEVAINNVKQMGYLSIYYAHKIRGATCLKAGNFDDARDAMGKAYCAWMAYSRSMDQTYHPDSFRNLAIAPDWKYADAAVLKEYTDLGGEGVPDCEDLFTLTTHGRNGSVALDPSGGVYVKGTEVQVTATPDFGYAFISWAGDVHGPWSPVTLEMNAKKNVIANFSVSPQPDMTPWIETYSMPDGTKGHGSPTSWITQRSSGFFQVSGNRLMINGGEVEGIYETAEIQIPVGRVNVSVEVQSSGGLDKGDYVQFYKVVDGGKPVRMGEEIRGGVSGTRVLVGSHVGGTRLKVRIVARVSASDESYFFDNLKVE